MFKKFIVAGVILSSCSTQKVIVNHDNCLFEVSINGHKHLKRCKNPMHSKNHELNGKILGR